MPEFLRLAYERLFEVRVLHHFWLDDGATVFDATGPTPRLLTYDVRRLLDFRPSAATAATVAGLRGVFRTTGLGFLVAVPDEARIPAGAAFEFFVTVVAPDYANYTAQPLSRPGITLATVPALSPQPVVTVVTGVEATSRVHRYKANVPVLSNLTGVARPGRLYLSRDYPAASADDAVESLVAVGNHVSQRMGDPPNATLNVVGAAADLPVFVHQGDVPPIVAPAGATGAPAFGIELDDATPPDVAAVIRLAPRRPALSPFDFAEPDGTPRPRVFEVHLQNRRTTWRYRKKGDGSLISTEAGPLPLTHFGNAGTQHKPEPAAIGAQFDNQHPPKIMRFVSDIYV